MKTITMPRLFTLLFCLSAMVYGQESNSLAESLERKNNIDITLGGMGLFTSINYNRIVSVKSNYFINTSVGIGIVPGVGGISYPHQLKFNLGSQNSFFELGVGGTYVDFESERTTGTKEKVTSYQLSPIIGWRKHFSNHLVFRPYASPLFHVSGEFYVEDYTVIPYGGIGLGYRF